MTGGADASTVGAAARSQIAEQVEKKASQIGDRIVSAADAVRGVGEQLGEQERSAVARVANGVADRVAGLADYLSRSSPERLAADARSFATREPLAFAGACFVAGMFLARFVKAALGGAGEPAGAPSSREDLEEAPRTSIEVSEQGSSQSRKSPGTESSRSPTRASRTRSKEAAPTTTPSS